MKTERIVLRLTDQDKKRWTEAAQARGMALSEYIRFVMNINLERKDESKQKP